VDVQVLTIIRSLATQIAPTPPNAIADDLIAHQFRNIRRQIPTLHLVAILNMVIINFVLWEQQVPPAYFAWTPLICIFNIARIVQWSNQSQGSPIPAAAAAFLRTTNWAAVATVSLVSAYSCVSFCLGLFAYPVLIPVSLAFGAFSIAHCLAPLRFASLASLLIGIIPSGLAMIFLGDFLSVVLGISAISVAIMKVGFLRDHYDQMVAGLELQHQIQTLANDDPLTGLLNRRAFREKLETVSSLATHGFGVALIDLDGFKQVNDTRGHHVGDALLIEVAARLHRHAGDGAIIGRLGGDEFVILIPQIANDAAMSARMTGLLAGLSLPAEIEGEPARIAASLGFATCPANGEDFDTLLHAADEALYAAKRSGKAQARGARPEAQVAAQLAA
jgi:diguanylate cyclase (GGDEF)-like protein